MQHGSFRIRSLLSNGPYAELFSVELFGECNFAFTIVCMVNC